MGSIHKLFFAAAAAGLLSSGTAAYAGSILKDLTIDTQGNGFGNSQNILTMQVTPSESGSVSWNGAANVYSGDADTNVGKSSTFVVNTISSDLDRLGLVINLNNTGGNPGSFLDAMTATFFNAATGASLATAVFNNPGDEIFQNGGLGGAGVTFRIVLTNAEKLVLTNLGLGNVRIGLSASLRDTDDGPDTIVVAQIPGTVIPLPAAAPAGLALLAGYSFIRRRQQPSTEM